MFFDWDSTDFRQSDEERNLFAFSDKSDLRDDIDLLNCTPPAIVEFPNFMRQKSWIAATVCFFLSMYLFVVLAIVCDDYLVPAMERLCYTLRMTYDVAGATFLAAATSAPELFVNFVATFITHGDIGLGTIVGSSVFNILVIAGVCGILTPPSKLDWWPVTRDTVWYLLAVATVTTVVWDSLVTWYEATVLILLYLLYIIQLVLDRRIQNCVRKEHTESELISEDPMTREEEPLQGFRDHVCTKPEQGSNCCRWAWWIIKYPAELMLACTVPSVRTIFFLSMVLAILWISAISYLLAWFLTVVGYNLHVPDSIMGLTVLAAGTSVPEVASSYIVSRKAALANGSSFLEVSLRYFDEQLLVDILPRATCPGEDEGSPMDEFADLFTVEQLRQGWVVLHVFAAIYFFILLAIICNDYFLPTVECICEDLHLSKDVAAATFMATATSMPEFFTNTISTLILESDMGLGTIIGSLMFNTLGVAGLAALAIDKPVQLDWWPIARDCFIYIFNTIILLVLAWGGSISFTESCIMMGFLVLYYLITFNNNKFMPAIRVFIEDRMNCCFSTRYDLTEPPENSAKAQLPLKKDPLSGDGLFVVNFPENTSSMSSTANLTHSKHWNGEDDEDDDMPKSIYAYPHDASGWMKFWWIFVFPIKFTLSLLIPHPIKHRRLYPLSFIMCILCIGGNAYLIVWMLTAFGVAIHVPTIVMGLTFLAAGSTMPEAVSSLISLRNGENGIGVSNSLGANSLAILLSLGVPWFIKNCINYSTGEPQQVGTQGIEYNILILIVSTVALFVVLSFSGYRLTKRVGVALFTIYGVFIVLQILIEMNVFFPRDCSS